MPPLSRRPAARAAVAASLAAGMLAAAGACADVAEPIPDYQDGWSAVHAQADGSNAVQVDGPRHPSPEWVRDLGAPPTGFAASGPDGQLVVSARTGSGCQMFTLALDTGRKQWCTWQNIGPGSMSPLVDQMAAVYVGNIGSADAFDLYGQVRWHTPVIGTPQPLQFLADRSVLAVTHLGQVNVLSTTTGRKLAPSIVLAPSDWPPPPDEGLQDCADAGPGCPVSFPPAVDTASDDFYFPFRAPGADGAVLVSMHYAPGTGNRSDISRSTPGADADGTVTERWRSQPVPGGVSSAPALSSDGRTVYVLDGEHGLWALDSEDGTPRWHTRLDLSSPATLSVTGEDMVIVAPDRADGAAPAPAGKGRPQGRGGVVLAVRDEGDTARVAWQRPGLGATGPVAVAANGLGYTVTRSAAGEAELTVLDLGVGGTVDTEPLDPRTGAAGTAVITNSGRIVVLGADGLVSVFD